MSDTFKPLRTTFAESEFDSMHSVIAIRAPGAPCPSPAHVAPGESTRIVEQLSEANQQWVAGKRLLLDFVQHFAGQSCDGFTNCAHCAAKRALAAAVPEEPQ